MSRGYYRLRPNTGYADAVTFVAPDDAAFSVSDFSGTVTRDATKIRLLRPIDDGQGYDNCAPGARVRFAVTLGTPGIVDIDLSYTGLVTRNDTYYPIGSLLIDGVATDFTNPAAWTSGSPHPTGDVTVVASLLSGSHTLEVVWPYDASMDFKGIRVPAGATIAPASARPSSIAVFLGDSIEQGFKASRARDSWPYLLSAAKSWQLVNLGYGGRIITPSDFTVAGAIAAGRVITNYGINNCFAGHDAATIQSAVESSISAFRAAAPTTPLYWINLFDCTSPSLITAPATARTAISDAFTAVGGANDHLIAGGTANGLPSSSTFVDLTHPGDSESVTIASVLGGLIS